MVGLTTARVASAQRAETQTIGNNVHAYMDRVGGADNNIPDTAASSVIDGGGRADWQSRRECSEPRFPWHSPTRL